MYGRVDAFVSKYIEILGIENKRFECIFRVHLTQSKFQTEKFCAWDFSDAALFVFDGFFVLLLCYFYEFVALGWSRLVECGLG